jgi:molybdenum cofactor guanylyltransferase
MGISDITGVVLAGGANSRFGGKTKSNEIIGDERIITSILKTIRPVFNEVIIVTNNPGEFSDITGCVFTGDLFLRKGPLGGIHAAMKVSSGNAMFVVAGDMPFLNQELILLQAREFVADPADALIPIVKGYLEPLHSIYSNRLAGKLEDLLANGSDYKVRSFLNTLSVRYFQVPDKDGFVKSFTNINTPGEADTLNTNKS